MNKHDDELGRPLYYLPGMRDFEPKSSPPGLEPGSLLYESSEYCQISSIVIAQSSIYQLSQFYAIKIQKLPS